LATLGKGKEAKRTKDTEPVNWPLLYWIKKKKKFNLLYSPPPLCTAYFFTIRQNYSEKLNHSFSTYHRSRRDILVYDIYSVAEPDTQEAALFFSMKPEPKPEPHNCVLKIGIAGI
jgi:hypothetical protein